MGGREALALERRSISTDKLRHDIRKLVIIEMTSSFRLDWFVTQFKDI